jgi:hypothetical protein
MPGITYHRIGIGSGACGRMQPPAACGNSHSNAHPTHNDADNSAANNHTDAGSGVYVDTYTPLGLELRDRIRKPRP